MKTVWIVAALLAGGTSASAQSVDISSCASIADDHARLACYDGLAASLHKNAPAAAQMAAPPSPSAAATPASPPQPVPSVASAPASRAATFGAETIRKVLTEEQKAAEVEELHAHVTAVQFSSNNRFTVTLDNGQVWRQLEADTSRARFRSSGGDTVVISKGALGSYNLVVEGRSVLFKVRRLQ